LFFHSFFLLLFHTNFKYILVIVFNGVVDASDGTVLYSFTKSQPF
jgi:hypothetical protein